MKKAEKKGIFNTCSLPILLWQPEASYALAPYKERKLWRGLIQPLESSHMSASVTRKASLREMVHIGKC